MESAKLLPIHPFNSDQLSPKIRVTLLIFFVAAIGLRLFFALYTPEYNDDSGKIRPFNDESLHLAYSQYLIKHLSFPAHTRFRSPENPDLIETYWIFNEAEYAQPPLFYVLNAPFALSSRPIESSRLFGVFLSSLLIIFGVSCSMQVFRDKNRAALLAMAFLGFHPVLVRIGSSISNDNLSWLISMIFFRLYLTKTIFEAKWKYAVLIGLGILSRISFVIWPLFLLLKIAIDGVRSRNLPVIKRELKAYTLMGIVSLLICGGWLLRNQMLYSDWTGLRALGWRSYVYTGSLYSLEHFITSGLRFSFFPIAEEPGWSPILTHAFFLLVIISIVLQRQQREAEFENPTIFRDFQLFNILNLSVFLITNLRLEYPESRHLLIGLLPLLSVAIAAFSINFKKAAVPVALIFNLVCLLAFF